MKKLLVGVALFGMVGLSACGLLKSDYESYWVLEKSRYNEADIGPSKLYERAQKDPNLVHYSSERITEGKMMVFLAFGEKFQNDKITVQEVKDKKDTTEIVVEVEKGKGTDKNPVLYIGVNKLRDNIKIVDTKGKEIFKLKPFEGSEFSQS